MKVNSLSVDESLINYLKEIGSDYFRSSQLLYIKGRNFLLKNSREGKPPQYPRYDFLSTNWQAELPEWLIDQRNQMTGPADDAELVVKLLNSNSPGVMLDLEDSMANTPTSLVRGILNIRDALYGELSYFKKGVDVRIKDSKTVVFSRVRGLHMTQHVEGLGNIPAPLFDLAAITHKLDADKLKHPLCFYIPKSESSGEALWWKNVFNKIERLNGWKTGFIKAMALVESHPMAYEMEQFAELLQPYLVGLNLGRWDYMASLIDYMFNDPNFLFPDRNSIPADIPFFQNLRHRMAYVCHKHGMLAIGGMSALFPNRRDEQANKIAQDKLKADKENEAACLMDGAWTGHPDQNEIAVNAFPFPNQLDRLPSVKYHRPDLRSFPKENLETTDVGTRDALRTSILYRHEVLSGKGAALIDGYMEDLATDRINRVMVSQRYHNGKLTLDKLKLMISNLVEELGIEYRKAANITLHMIVNQEFNPV